MLNLATRKCVATLWTLDAAKKEGEYFAEYVGMGLADVDISSFWLDQNQTKVVAKKAKDGVWDVVVNAKKFSRKIFDEAMNNAKVVSRNGG